MSDLKKEQWQQLDPRTSGFGSGLISEPLAVVSVACKLPGADDLDSFWKMLVEGKSAIGPIPEEILNRDLYFDPSRKRRGTSYTDVGAVVNRDRCFERTLGMSGDELKIWDECHLYFASVAEKAWNGSFFKPQSSSEGKCGVFIGHSAGSNCSEQVYGSYSHAIASILSDCPSFQTLPDKLQEQMRLVFQKSLDAHCPERKPSHLPNWDVNDIARLTAKVTQTSGPHLVIESACASSSVALCAAGMALNANQIDIAIVGGASYNKPESLILFSQAQSCSATNSRPFDDHADGLISSEGFVAIVLKRLDDAIAAGDEIHGVITGAGMASDGKGKSLWAPRHEGQIESMRRAYRDPVQAAQVQYVEAHATSTQVGDATETNALAAFFREVGVNQKLPIGSVKSNLGHTLESAGLVGLLKVLLAMKHDVIPPSINFQKPNAQISWNEVPLQVVTQPIAWPKSKAHSPKIAAVNSFGIGGLNVHLVVTEYLAKTKTSQTKRRHRRELDEGIAIVGLGCVLPGAAKTEQLESLLTSVDSFVTSPPKDRWIASEPCAFASKQPDSAANVLGGFIGDFEFDWQRHRIPPKQVKTANPLQFMLLQAANDAIQQAGLLADRSLSARTAVIVGAIFGGEFGNGLQLGLRLQSLLEEIRASASKGKLTKASLVQLQQEFEKCLLDRLPALLDETGSFTSSTLASRITKHFDLMGGAFSLDSSDESAANALNVAVQMLREQSVDAVVCASGSYALDFVTYDKLYLRGLLPKGWNDSKCWPAEGVVTLALQRLSDARNSGRKILGVIERIERYSVSLQRPDSLSVNRLNQLHRKIGRIAGAEALVGLAASCKIDLSREDQALHSLVLSHQSGACTEIQFKTGSIENSTEHGSNVVNKLLPAKPISESCTSKINPETRETASRSTAMIQHESIWTAGCFPGQGLNPANLLDSLFFKMSPFVEIVNRANEVLKRIDSPSYKDLLRSDSEKTADKIWASQAVVLITNVAISQCFVQKNMHFDVLIGHSLGEISALVHAKSLTLETALLFLSKRSLAVANAVAAHESGLLSISSDSTHVEKILRSFVHALSITHINSPKQTVVGGPVADLHKLQSLCKDNKVASALLAVPAAYHSRILESARWELLGAVRDLEIRPPAIPVLSTVTGRFDSDPEAIRQNLVDQLVTPLNYVRDIERLEKFGTKCFVEIGPESVLTKLHQAIALQATATNAVTMFGKDTADAIGQRGKDHQQSSNSLNSNRSNSDSTVAAPMSGKSRLIDATLNRRMEMRQKSTLLNQRHTPEIDSGASINHSLAEDRSRIDEKAAAKNNWDELQQFIIDFIVEHTGYPKEMVDPSWDLETELGVDSIKQAQLFGELQQTFSLDVRQIRGLVVRSINDICDIVMNSSKGDASIAPRNANNLFHGETQENPRASLNYVDRLEDSIPNFVTRSQSNYNAVANPRIEEPKSTQPNSKLRPQTSQESPLSGLAAFVVDFVVEHTGYPLEMVDLHAEYEAELGIDSIKLAQLIGEIRSTFNIELTIEDRKSLLECRTLQDIIDCLADRAIDSTNRDSIQFKTNVEDSSTGWTQDEREQDVSSSPETRFVASTVSFDVEHSNRNNAVQQSKSATLNPVALLKEKNTKPGSKRHRYAAADANRFEVEFDFCKQHANSLDSVQTVTDLEPVEPEEADSVTHRFVMRMVPAPITLENEFPQLYGRVLIVGENDIADRLVSELKLRGAECLRLRSEDAADWPDMLSNAWQNGALPHLFITTPHDREAMGVKDARSWGKRMDVGVESIFWLTQRWYSLVCRDNLLQDSSLFVMPNLGGDFGLDANVPALEGGALTGLVKALIIEAWMAGERRLNFKVIDIDEQMSPANSVNAIFAEMCYGSYDTEIGYKRNARQVVRAAPAPIQRESSAPMHRLPRSGDIWICTGGARGISAYVSEALANRYQLSLNLIGTTPLTSLSSNWFEQTDEERRALKLSIMQDARDNPSKYRNKNPLKAWQEVEKVIEIESTLKSLREKGHKVQYFACDVADATALKKVVSEIQMQQGPVRGVLHGAGVGQDARFERKIKEKVRQCFDAKITGAWSLLNALDLSELTHFIAFGSISGRFGANGHTDYSGANDGLVKVCDWLRGKAPHARVIGFHWHAWGDIGMATKPETKLALESVGMQFMPASEGLKHLIRELESDSNETEVVITDHRYYRAFYPAESVATESPLLHDQQPALLEPDSIQIAESSGRTSVSAKAILLPKSDPFLIEHTLKQQPLLPIVVDIELLVETALQLSRSVSNRISSRRNNNDSIIASLKNIVVHSPMKFFCDAPHELQVIAEPTASQDMFHGKVFATVLNRHADVVAKDRLLCDATISFSEFSFEKLKWEVQGTDSADWHRPDYTKPSDLFYSGAPFRLMHRFALKKSTLVADLSAPSLVELAGLKRNALGWETPSAVLDVALYASGILAWDRIAECVCLPTAFDMLSFMKHPRPGQRLRVFTRIKEQSDESVRFDFDVVDMQKQLYIAGRGYQAMFVKQQ